MSISTISHVFCDACNRERMQGAERGYLSFQDDDGTATALAACAGWKWWILDGRVVDICDACSKEGK